MKTTTEERPRRETLSLRISAEARNMIDLAAAAKGETWTDFILGAARRAAEEALLDQTILSVSPEAYAEFLRRLDAPAQPNERLRRTMRTAQPRK